MNQQKKSLSERFVEKWEAEEAADPGPVPDSEKYLPEIEAGKEALECFEAFRTIVQLRAQDLEKAARRAATVNPQWQWVGALAHVVKSACEQIQEFVEDPDRSETLLPTYLRVSEQDQAPEASADDEQPFHSSPSPDTPDDPEQIGGSKA